MSSTGKEAIARDATPSNPRGIPYAPFVDKVEDYVSSRAEVEPTLRRFQEMIAKYQFMEQNLQRRVAGLKDKLPDIRKTLETVRFLKLRTSESDPIETTFELNDTLYAKAQIPPTDEVYLWLGVRLPLERVLWMGCNSPRANNWARPTLCCHTQSKRPKHFSTRNCRLQSRACQIARRTWISCGNKSRLWRWPWLEYITGTLCRSARRRKKKKNEKGRAHRVLWEVELLRGPTYLRLAPGHRPVSAQLHSQSLVEGAYPSLQDSL